MLVDTQVRAVMEAMIRDTGEFLAKNTMPFERHLGDERHVALRVRRAYPDPDGKPIFALAVVYVTEHAEEIDVLLANNGGPLRT